LLIVVGASVTIPVTNGKLATGTWQGIYLLEFRDYKHQRNIVATINGQK
jgi:secondary thiamine-phosphate synthase enzyme